MGHRTLRREGDGQFPVSQSASNKHYKRWLRLIRRALVECAGLEPAEAALFGTQSMRRGGNTNAWKCGAPKDVRMAMGAWKTPRVETEYLEWMMDDKLALLKNGDEFLTPL